MVRRDSNTTTKTDAKKLWGWHHEDVSDVGNIKTQILEQQNIPLLLEDTRMHKMEINDDGVALKMGDGMGGGGGAGAILAAPAAPPLKFMSTT